VFAAGEHGGVPYFVMEYLEGGTLAARVAGAPQPPAQAARWVADLAGAVQAAHAAGVVHRDLKPQNVLLDADGRLKVADFGLAQLAGGGDVTATGAIMGTPSYMAPEQASGLVKTIGPAADIYALGAILYELLTGRPPFRGESREGTLTQVLFGDPLAPRQLVPSVPRDLETVCLKCLEKEPRRRYRSSAALEDDLRRFLAGRPITARPAGPVERAWRWCRRNPLPAILIGAVGLTFAAGTAASTAFALVARAREKDAAAARDQAREQAGRAERNAARSLATAEVLADELVAAIKPVAGTRSPNVQQILERAAAVYDDLRAEEPTPAVLAARARLLAAFSEIYRDTEQTRAAAAAAAEARRTFEDLVASDPANSAYTRGLARALDREGQAAIQRGRLPEAVAAFRRGVELLRPLHAADPDEPGVRTDLANLHVGAAAAFYHQGALAAAGEEVVRADALIRPLAARDPMNADWQRAFARAREGAGHVEYYLPDRRGDALTAYTEAMTVYDRLTAADPGNTEWQVGWVRAAGSAAECLAWEGLYPAARTLLNEIIPRARLLHETDPTNGRRLNEYQRARLNLLSVQQWEDPKVTNAPDRVALVRSMLAGHVERLAHDPENALLRLQTAGLRLKLAMENIGTAGKPGDAADRRRVWELMREARAELAALTAADPTNARAADQLRAIADLITRLVAVESTPDAWSLLEDSRDWFAARAAAGTLTEEDKAVRSAVEKTLAGRK
jgi:tetratricopeptide (TPR) repeat protein